MQCLNKRLLLTLIADTTVVLVIVLVVLTRSSSDKGGNQTESNSLSVIDRETSTSSTIIATDITPTAAKRMIVLPGEFGTLEALMKADEGVTYAIYSDSQGVLTFGIRHVITEDDPEYGKPVGTAVSEDRVREAFLADIDKVLQDVCAWRSDCNTWPSEVKEIIANMMFDLGIDKMNQLVEFKTAIQARDWTTAADEMTRSQWSQQDNDRVARLIHMMQNVASGVDSLILTDEEQKRLKMQLQMDVGIQDAVLLDYRFILIFGIGHIITSRDPEYNKTIGTKVSEERVQEAFEADLHRVLMVIYFWSRDCNTWPSEVKQVIANMMFNLGEYRLGGLGKLRAKLLARDWAAAADEIADIRGGFNM